jgi:two-component system, NarL family, nitrate/nitrite response regulator NarL
VSHKYKVAIIDDHPLMREGIAATFASAGGFTVVAQGSSADEAVQITKDKRPDLVLMDIYMPGCSIEATRAIAAACPDTKVVIFTNSEEPHHVTRALEASARGYVLKGISGPDLVKVMLMVLSGRCYVTPELAARLLVQSTVRSQKEKPADIPHQELTVREEEIIGGVATGKTNKEIARALNLSEKTVKHHMSNIMQKLHVRNRVEAVLYLRKFESRRD